MEQKNFALINEKLKISSELAAIRFALERNHEKGMKDLRTLIVRLLTEARHG